MFSHVMTKSNQSKTTSDFHFPQQQWQQQQQQRQQQQHQQPQQQFHFFPGINLIKPLFFVNDGAAKETRVFVDGEFFRLV
jgi:hypothetical protein